MTDSEQGTGHEASARMQVARALDKLTAEQVAQISPRFIRERYADGEMIIRQGDPADRFFIVYSGRAEISHEDLSGNVTIIESRLPGEYFGEIGLFKNQPRTATVRAPLGGEVEVLALERADFQELIQDSRATEAHVAQEMMRRLINLANIQ